MALAGGRRMACDSGEYEWVVRRRGNGFRLVVQDCARRGQFLIAWFPVYVLWEMNESHGDYFIRTRISQALVRGAIADGLRVPAAVGDFLMLRVLRESHGTAITVEDDEMLKYAGIMGALTGVFPAPEGAACLAAQVGLLEKGWIKPNETVVLFITGTGLKYAHLWK